MKYMPKKKKNMQHKFEIKQQGQRKSACNHKFYIFRPKPAVRDIVTFLWGDSLIYGLFKCLLFPFIFSAIWNWSRKLYRT